MSAGEESVADERTAVPFGATADGLIDHHALAGGADGDRSRAAAAHALPHWCHPAVRSGGSEPLAEGHGREFGVVGDVDLNMFTLQFGRDFAPVGGFDMAAYLEVGYLYGDFNTLDAFYKPALAVKYDLDRLPVTLNLKFERNLVGGLGVYLSGGLGYAWSSIKPQGGHEENDGGFYAQAAAGLVYNFCPNFEMFGGARWIYFDNVDVAGAPLADSNAFGWEVGLRYNF